MDIVESPMSQTFIFLGGKENDSMENSSRETK
jgi:hypothetical protein